MRAIVILWMFMAFNAQAQVQRPQLKGGLENFVERHKLYPPYSRNNCIQGTIRVAFKLDPKGQVYAATIDKGLGIDLDDEALRLVRMSSGKWTMPQNYDTTAVLMVPINFLLKGFDCERKTRGEIAQAIQAYKTEEDLRTVVSNFYKSRRNGTAKAEDEARISRIKEDLGIDDEYLLDKIEVGLKKIKQGDREGACKDFNFVRDMGSDKADEYLSKYCK